VIVRQRINNHDLVPSSLLTPKGSAKGIRAGFYVLAGNEANGELCLSLKDPHKIGIPHWCEWVILHTAFVQWHPIHEKMALVNCAAIGRKGRAGEGEFAVSKPKQRLRHRPDIPLIRRVEGGAILEEQMLRAGLTESRRSR
jgi:hypothetical protein